MARYVFGPVPSRRLGRSLGVDLVPMKTCTYDCLYCQLGATTDRTAERRVWAPTQAVLAEVREKLGSAPDTITLSGSGEPTLAANVGEVIAGVRAMTDVRVAVLTNGSLLWRDDVRQALAAADVVAPSLDAGDAETFARVNRPDPSVTFERLVDGLVAFGEAFEGEIWLEVMLLEGITANESQVRKMAAIAGCVRPDRIQLNTVTRPPADARARPFPRGELERLARVFGQGAEVIADWEGVHEQRDFSARREDVLGMLSRRPCTLEDVASGLGLHPAEAVKYVQELEDEGRIISETIGGRLYYKGGEDDGEREAVPREGESQ